MQDIGRILSGVWCSLHAVSYTLPFCSPVGICHQSILIHNLIYNQNTLTFSINCVFESMRKPLKTLCRRQSVLFVSWTSLSICFLISCVLAKVCWENSCRKRKSYKKTHTRIRICIWSHTNLQHLFTRIPLLHAIRSLPIYSNYSMIMFFSVRFSEWLTQQHTLS